VRRKERENTKESARSVVTTNRVLDSGGSRRWEQQGAVVEPALGEASGRVRVEAGGGSERRRGDRAGLGF
jgi:hypothetical protein